MKKNLGSLLALYPTPLVVLGVMNGNKPNWTLLAHMGTIGHDRLMISVMKEHLADKLIHATKAMSLNIVTDDFLEQADFVGCNSGIKVDKSAIFPWKMGEHGTPLMDDAKVILECTVDDLYNHPTFDNFIVQIKATWAEDTILNKDGKIDYNVFKPVLFEFPSYSYIKTGEILGPCRQMHKTSPNEDKLVL